MAKRGPPKKFTAEVKARVVECLTMGLSLAEALTIVGFDRRSYVRECQTDLEFARGVKGASSEGKLHHIRRIHNAEERWQASAWFLERKYGAEYGQKVKLEHGGAVRVVEEIVEAVPAHETNGHANGAASPGAGRLPPQ